MTLIMKINLGFIFGSPDKFLIGGICVAPFIGILALAHILSAVQKLKISAQNDTIIDRAMIKLWINPFREQEVRSELIRAGCNNEAIRNFFRIVYIYRGMGFFLMLYIIVFLR